MWWAWRRQRPWSTQRRTALMALPTLRAGTMPASAYTRKASPSRSLIQIGSSGTGLCCWARTEACAVTTVTLP
jgi:hypothetical protein